MKITNFTRILIILTTICLSTFVNLIKLEKLFALAKSKDKQLDNSNFEDDLAEEDKLDESLKTRKAYRDYNSEIEVDTEELVNKIRDDLTGEEVSYKFD